MTGKESQERQLPSGDEHDGVTMARLQNIRRLEEAERYTSRLLDIYKEREQHFILQLKNLDEKYENSLVREQQLTQQLLDTRQRVENVTLLFAQREKESYLEKLQLQKEIERNQSLAAEQLLHATRENQKREEAHYARYTDLQQLKHNQENELKEQLALSQQAAKQQELELCKQYAEYQHELQQAHAKVEMINNQAIEHVKLAASVVESELRQQLKVAMDRLLPLQDEILLLQSELQQVINSFSWWFTAPLRWLVYAIRPNGSSVKIRPKLSHSISKNIERISITPLFGESPMVSYAPNSTVAAARTIDELLGHFDAAFVYCSYITLLGREPDPEGMAYYLGRLRSGYSKSELIAQIALSSEGRNCEKPLKGLDELLARQRRAQHWFWRRFSRSDRLERQCNRLEYTVERVANQLLLLENDMGDHLDRLSQSIGAINGRIDSLKANRDVGLTLSEQSPTESLEVVSSDMELSTLTPEARKMHTKLAAIHKRI